MLILKATYIAIQHTNPAHFCSFRDITRYLKLVPSWKELFLFYIDTNIKDQSVVVFAFQTGCRNFVSRCKHLQILNLICVLRMRIAEPL